MSDEPMIVQWAEAAIGRNDNSHTTIAKANLRELLAHERALRTIAAQLAEALERVEWGDTCESIGIGYCLICEADGHPNEKHAEKCSLAAALEAWETYQR